MRFLPRNWLLLMLALAFMGGIACSQPTPATRTPVAAAISPAPVSTLVPTYTRGPDVVLPTATPFDTPEPSPTAPTATPISFTENVVQLWYEIPGIRLNRRLQGNVSSQIIVVDETTGVAIQRNNQAGVLLDLQQVLPRLTLGPAPDGCDLCVRVRFELPFSELSGEGWLQSPVLLASVENFMSVALGPHFPPGTVVGLRRSASIYAPAHTVALTEDGRLWRWLATEARVPDPVLAETVAPTLLSQLNALSIDGLANDYNVRCPTVPLETLGLYVNGQEKLIDITCPEYALPTTLLPLYAQLDALAAVKLADIQDVPERPPIGLPLTAVLDYQRADGAQLTLYQDGQLRGIDTNAVTYTGTMTTTSVMSLTRSLLESGELSPGLTTFLNNDTVTETREIPLSVLLVRGVNGIYDAEWPNPDVPFLAGLNAMLDALIQPLAIEATAIPEATIEDDSEQIEPTATPLSP